MVLTGRGASGCRSMAGKLPSGSSKSPSMLRAIVTERYGDPEGVGCFVWAQGSVVGVPLR